MKTTLLTLLCFYTFQLTAQLLIASKDCCLVSESINGIFIDKNYTEIEVLKGFRKITDTSFSKSTTFKEYGIKHLKNKQKHILLLLDRLEDENGNRTGTSKILNSLEINLGANEGIVIGYCGEDAMWDIDKIYAVSFNLAKARQGDKFLSAITHIWKIEEKNGFQKIKLTKDFNCLEDTNYLIELAQL